MFTLQSKEVGFVQCEYTFVIVHVIILFCSIVWVVHLPNHTGFLGVRPCPLGKLCGKTRTETVAIGWAPMIILLDKNGNRLAA